MFKIEKGIAIFFALALLLHCLRWSAVKNTLRTVAGIDGERGTCGGKFFLVRRFDHKLVVSMGSDRYQIFCAFGEHDAEKLTR